MHSRLPKAARACAIHSCGTTTLVGGRVLHTRTICSFSGSLATHELCRSLLRPTITNSELEVYML